MVNLSGARNSSWLSRLIAAVSVLASARPRSGLLDPRTLSDHLKRDMGFLDGNDPEGRS